EREVLAQLRLGQSKTGAPEAAQHRAGGGEQVAADRACGRPLAQAWDRLESDLLGQVLGVCAVADTRVDECIDELQLVKRDVGGPRRGRELDDLRLPAPRGRRLVRRHARPPRRGCRRAGSWRSTPAYPALRARPRTSGRLGEGTSR